MSENSLLAPPPRPILFVAVLLIAAMLAPSLSCQGAVSEAARGGEWFVRNSVAVQKRIVAELRDTAEAIGGDYWDSVRAAVTAGEARRAARARLGKVKKPKKRAPKAADELWEMPAAVTYVYGHQLTVPSAGSASVHALATRRVPVELVLLGMMPDTDLALAELERRLDGDRSADAFAVFLESWRNGDESFYEALDRTAGTADSVFFYDVMLGDFVGTFAKGRAGAGALKKSLQAAHDALHDAFLCYRQYRAFREAVALSLLLPPDVPLPARLCRYEVKVAGSYSLREQVTMVLARHDWDLLAVVAKVVATAEPLAEPLWSRQHDPYPKWSKLFDAELAGMVAAAGDSDVFLRQALATRQAHAAKMRKVAVVAGVALPGN